jgi:hypothetical protein
MAENRPIHGEGVSALATDLPFAELGDEHQLGGALGRAAESHGGIELAAHRAAVDCRL